MSEIGMAYQNITTTAHEIREAADTLETVKNICDGAVVAMSAVSWVPGAAAVTGPVIGVYESVAPTLGEVIDLCQLVDDYLKMATQVMQNVDDVCSGNFNSIDVDQLQSFLH
jgi:uncharacterized protein YukE